MYDPFDFEKLYSDARAAVVKSESIKEWTKHGYENKDVWVKEFKMGQQDLFWLCTELLDLALVPEVHRPITDDFFIKKNPYIDAKDWKDAIAKQSTIKNRMILYPRSSFKSSIDMADVIQWMLCFPNIRIIYMTAEETLANDFVQQTRSHFQIGDTGMTRFHMLYYSHCIPANKRESENQFLSPARTQKQNQPTILALSLGMSTAGKHADVGKFDDCVSNKNSGPMSTPEQRKKVTDEIKLARPLIDPYGYKDYVGTYYDSADAYVSLQDALSDLRVMIAPAWTVKPHARKKQIHELLEEDVDLLFPADSKGVPRLTFKFLMDEYRVDAFIFSCQYMLNPSATKIVKFTEQMLRKQIIPAEQFPQDGTYFLAGVWDFAKTANAGSDRSVGVVGKITTEGPLAGRLFVTEFSRGRFSKSELPFAVANQWNRWKPLKHAGIEKSPGADFLENDILRALARVGYIDCPSIEWIKVENTKDAKNARAETLENNFVANTIFFSEDIPKDVMDEVIKEFTQFKSGSNRKDDSIDALARLAAYIPKDITIPQTEQQKQTAAWEVLQRKQNHEKMFYLRENESAGTDKGSHWKTDGYDRKPDIPTPPPTHWEGLPIYPSIEHQIYGT